MDNENNNELKDSNEEILLESIVLLKLRDGSEVIGDLVQVGMDGKSMLYLNNPFTINYMFSSKQARPVVSLFRYMPFADSRVIPFDVTDVMQLGMAREAMVSYYKHVLIQYQTTIDDSIDLEMTLVSNKTSVENVEELYGSLLDRMTNNNNKPH